MEVDVDILIETMNKATDKDIEANKNKKPALAKMMASKDVFQQLRKQLLQERFLDKGGCQQFAEWLSPLPDGTLPNNNLIKNILSCIDSLMIETGHLEGNHLGKIIHMLAEGRNSEKTVA